MKCKFILLITLLFSLNSNSQNFSGMEYLLLVAEDERNQVFQEYLRPLITSVNYSMASGWSHTAKTHKKLGFDITLSANALFIPSSAETYSTSALNSITSSTEFLPTVLGGKTNETMSITLFGEGSIQELTASFTAPSGIKEELPLGLVAIPSIQVGLGLPFKTDLIVRYIPTRSNKNTSMGLKGVGLKHNLLQHFGPVDKIPFIDLSLLAAYSAYSIDYNIQKTSNLGGQGQQAVMSINNYVVQLVSSIDLKLVTFYASAGYSKGFSNLNILGSYSLIYNVAGSPEDLILSITDPLDISWETESISASAGLAINLPGIRLFADYTAQNYNSVSAGFSLSIR